MRKLLLILLLLTVGSVILYASSDAGFLDSPAPVANPAEWHGAAWYCLDGHFPDPIYIVAGPFAQHPDCSDY